VPTRVPVSAAAFGLILATGCAHSESAADRHFAEMGEALVKVQAEHDRSSKRLGDLAFGPDEGRSPTPPGASAPPGVRSVPRTVQIGEGEDAGESDDPNDPNARPEIRLQGGARPARAKTTRGRPETRIDVADESVAPDAARSAALDPDAKKSYEAALALVNAKQYDRALEALAAFLVRWPDHPYAENALYWRGEAFFARGEYLRAAEQFESVLVRFGSGRKAADALLKIGMCHDRLGSPGRAKEYWDRLRRDFPRSEAAAKIPRSSGEARPNETNEESKGRRVGPKESR
ncbi:MAG TPA: tol-pal system protein YbgF, partial [Labilithrix sp.]|nr:tol-pal system protein YbgF [Labilithrix sp.]